MIGEIMIESGRIVESNFNDHQMIHLRDAPRIDVEFSRSDTHLGGGEPAVPPIVPAVMDAIYGATGIRVRNRPRKRHPPVSYTHLTLPTLLLV